MPCITDAPSVTKSEWLEHMLCQACRYLTPKQIQSIRGLDIWQDLWPWYQGHLLMDIAHYRKVSQEDHQENHYVPTKMYHTEEEKKEYAQKQIERCISEAKRMGWKVEICEGSISIE